jgi:alkylation response protein AidB-like acyl-CoA dehydrogenase
MQVFANLILPGGRNEGFHAFLVPIRDKDGKAMPGVGIADCGYKMGLNGVDNGRLWFNGVRVPLDNLLNKVSVQLSSGLVEVAQLCVFGSRSTVTSAPTVSIARIFPTRARGSTPCWVRTPTR